MERGIMKKLVVGLVVTLMLIGFASAEEKKANIVIATGGLGGVYYYYGTSVAEMLSKGGLVQANAIQTAASVDNILLIERRSEPQKNVFYTGTVLPDSCYLAYTGQLDKFKDHPAKDVRILWAMYPNLLHIVTDSGAGIKKLADLKGKRVSTGAPGSGTEVEALMVLEAAGIQKSELGKQERLGASESSEALASGTLDAYFWSGGLPTASVTELATTLARKGGHIEFLALSPEDPIVPELLKRFPGVLEPSTIPKAVYGTEKDVPTLAFWNLFVCPASLPEQTAYDLTKTVFDGLPALHESVKASVDTNLENAVKFVKGTIPYHEGALRYFKEKSALK